MSLKEQKTGDMRQENIFKTLPKRVEWVQWVSVFQSNHYFMVQQSIVQIINSTFAKAIKIKSMFELTQTRSHQSCKETKSY